MVSFLDELVSIGKKEVGVRKLTGHYERIYIAILSLFLALAFGFCIHLKWQNDDLRNSLDSTNALLQAVIAQAAVNNASIYSLTALYESMSTGSPGNSEGPLWPYPTGEFSAGVDSNFTLTDGTVFTQGMHLDRGITVYPAIETKGSVYIQGNLIVDTGSILFATASGRLQNLSLFYDQFVDMPGQVCAAVTTCQHGTRNILTCACMCDIGWTGTECDQSTCNNQGTWSVVLQACVCTAPFTSVSYCIELDCGPFGAPNPSYTACVCKLGYEGSSCETLVPQPSCTVDSCDGICIDNQCVCEGAQFGPNCEYQCATPNISHSLCPFRSNWAYDMDCIIAPGGSDIVCTCGGGYELYSYNMAIGEMRCDAATTNITDCRATFALEGPICCAPGVDCSAMKDTLCNSGDNLCCAAFHETSLGQCNAAGCSWCQESQYCIARSPAASGCLSPAYLYTDIVGNWSLYHYSCTGNESTIPPQTGVYATACNAVAQKRYSDIYLGCGGYSSSTCLLAARSQVYIYAWPELDVWPSYATGRLYRLNALTPSLPSLCVSANPSKYAAPSQVTAPILALGTRNPEAFARVVPAVWTCGHHSIPARRLPKSLDLPSIAGYENSGVVLRVADQLDLLQDGAEGIDSTQYNIFISTRTGNKFCLVAGQPSLADLIQYFGSTTLQVNAYFFNLRETSWSYVYMKASVFCSRFVVRDSIVTDAETGLSLSLPNSDPATFAEMTDARWLEEGSHVVVQNFNDPPLSYIAAI